MDDRGSRLSRLEHAFGLSRKVRDRKEGGGGAGDRAGASIREQLERLEERALWRRDRKRPEGRPTRRLDEVLDGHEVDTPLGPCFEIKSTFRAGYRHGQHPIGRFQELDLAGLKTLCGDPWEGRTRPENIAFLDLETTGLSLGAGTYAFLTGIGYLRDGQYHLHQIFLRDFREEEAFLHRIGRILEGFSVLATFNGKCYDTPLLETRYAMCSQEPPTRGLRAWDLLYPARRLWSDRLQDCTLGTVERERLGVERSWEDIRGDRIPEVYFRFVHLGDATDLDRIVYHNAMDILSLTALAVHMDQCLEEEDANRSNLLSIGRLYEKRGDVSGGKRFLEVAARAGSRPGERQDAAYHLARLYKSEGDYASAMRIWEDLMEAAGERFLDCCEEVAKYYEHRVRAYEKAIEAVDRALVHLGERDGRRRGDLEKRRKRLLRKGARA